MKNLIIYFSWSNNTKRLVEQVNSEFKFDTVRLTRKEPYSTDYNECAYVEAKQEIEQKVYPEINDLGVDVGKYDRILLFFPIWWYTFPMPVASLIKNVLKGFKGEVVLFENSYSNIQEYVKNSLRDFKAIDKNIKVSQGLFNKSYREHIEFIKNL